MSGSESGQYVIQAKKMFETVCVVEVVKEPVGGNVEVWSRSADVGDLGPDYSFGCVCFG